MDGKEEKPKLVNKQTISLEDQKVKCILAALGMCRAGRSVHRREPREVIIQPSSEESPE